MNNFDKNIFILNDYDNTIKDIDKEKCKEQCINNNYEGFTYKGDKNKCYQFKSHNFANKIDDDMNKYNIQTFLKTKKTIDFKNPNDQLNPNNYFTEINNYGYMLDNYIDTKDVNNKDECINSCITKNNCKSIIYLEQPKECNFYKSKNMKTNKDINNYDTYTIKNNVIPNIPNIPNISNISNISNKEPLLFNCSGLKSTNPFCTNEYVLNLNNKLEYSEYSDCEKIEIDDDIGAQKTQFNKICNKKFGDEYIFDDNIYNKNTIIKCDDDYKKIKCKINLNNGYIEHFNNINEYSNIYVYICLIFIIIILYFFIKKLNYFI